jgi:hypothetical protein
MVRVSETYPSSMVLMPPPVIATFPLSVQSVNDALLAKPHERPSRMFPVITHLVSSGALENSE